MASVTSTNNVSSDLMTKMNGTKSATSSTEEIQDRFLKLLVEQLKNQDPLNPTDNSQLTSQMAQLSTVTGIDNLNNTLGALQSSYQTSQALQATDMIGHGVLVTGSKINLNESQGIFGVELPSSADSVQVKIKNAAGSVVKTMDLGAQTAGTMPLTWDGKTDAGDTAADGSYTFEVTAAAGGAKVSATALSFGEVASVTTNSEGVKITMPAIGTVAFSDVRQIY